MEDNSLTTEELYNKDYGPFGIGLYGNDSLFTTEGFGGFLDWMVTTNKTLPSWWSQRRDHELRKAALGNNFLTSAVYTIQLLLYGIKFGVRAKDTGIEKHIRLADEYNTILERSMASGDFERFLLDLLICDNGGFLFIDGPQPAHKPLSSIPTGLKHLDSLRCQRTGDTDYPVIYWHNNADGNRVPLKIHYTRIFTLTQMPSQSNEMHGVGFSFVSRAFNLAETLFDIQTYESEVLGTRSAEEVIYATGAKSADLQDAFKAADLDSDNSGLERFGKRVFMGFRDPNSSIGKLLLKNLPENFNKRDYVEITLTLFALAAGVSANTFYDSVKSGSTRASAQISDVISQRKLHSWYIQKMMYSFSEIFLPSGLKLVLPEEDQDSDGTKARIKANLSLAREKNLKSGVSSIRVEREKQFANGELSHSQFEQLELADGRLANGLPIEALFSSSDRTLQSLLIFTDNPLDFKNNDVEETIELIKIAMTDALNLSLNGRTGNLQKNGKLAYYALLWLKKQYEKLSNNTFIEDKPEDLIDIDDSSNTIMDINQYNDSGTEQIQRRS